MKIINATVEKLPENCLMCDFCTKCDWDTSGYLCLASDSGDDGDYKFFTSVVGRQDWCPLITLEESIRHKKLISSLQNGEASTVKNFLLKFFKEVVSPCAEEQIKADQRRWGDTWAHRAHKGQEERIFQKFVDYYDQYRYGDNPIPWIKIICLCNIALARDINPKQFSTGEKNEN